jgi:hypothetical protein
MQPMRVGRGGFTQTEGYSTLGLEMTVPLSKIWNLVFGIDIAILICDFKIQTQDDLRKVLLCLIPQIQY